jgi:antitoxin component YwqK of YwqJK toxin-antitoxin module
MENLTYKEEKQDDGFWYKYYVDANGLKQGEMKIYFADDNGDITDKIQATINYKDDIYYGIVESFDKNGHCFFRTNFTNGSVDGLATIGDDDHNTKTLIFKDGDRINEDGTKFSDK